MTCTQTYTKQYKGNSDTIIITVRKRPSPLLHSQWRSPSPTCSCWARSFRPCRTRVCTIFINILKRNLLRFSVLAGAPALPLAGQIPPNSYILEHLEICSTMLTKALSNLCPSLPLGPGHLHSSFLSRNVRSWIYQDEVMLRPSAHVGAQAFAFPLQLLVNCWALHKLWNCPYWWHARAISCLMKSSSQSLIFTGNMAWPSMKTWSSFLISLCMPGYINFSLAK